MTTPIIMAGAAGRMGRCILECAAQDSEIEIIGGLEEEQVDSSGIIEEPIETEPGLIPNAKSAILIHFSSPEATISHLAWSVKNAQGVVIGTTGFDLEQQDAIILAAKKIPIVQASNTSTGVNTLFKLTEQAATILGPEYDIEIVEMHHRHKQDAPSGTARTLGEICAKARGGAYDDLAVDGRSGITGERPVGQIGMHALRGGGVVGEHTVIFASAGERVELSIKSGSRETYAQGALKAATWVADDRAPGLYDMQDVLGLRD